MQVSSCPKSHSLRTPSAPYNQDSVSLMCIMNALCSVLLFAFTCGWALSVTCAAHTHTPSHTHSHASPHTNFPHSITHAHTHTFTHTHTTSHASPTRANFPHSITHTHRHTHRHTRTLTPPPPHMPTFLTLSRARTHTHARTHTRTHTDLMRALRPASASDALSWSTAERAAAFSGSDA